jgi:uncharacterized phage-associated protein
MNLPAMDVANYFLSKADEDAGDLISNLKLQKLLYYAQGFCLALYGEPLFTESIRAWKHGPVVLEVYHHFKKYGDVGLPRPKETRVLSKRVRTLLDEVYKVYGQFSAWKLRNLTHREPPWADTAQSRIISHASLKAYFKTQLV